MAMLTILVGTRLSLLDKIGEMNNVFWIFGLAQRGQHIGEMRNDLRVFEGGVLLDNRC